MDYSPRLKREAEKHKVPPQTIVMADLMAIGYTVNEAYNVAYSENASLTKQRNLIIRDGITDAVGFSELVKARSLAVKGILPSSDTEGAENTSGQMTKEDVAAQLKTQIDLLPDGSKEKADVLMKYADLFAMKKEDKKGDDEEIIRIWMPLTCDICPYKKNYETGK